MREWVKSILFAAAILLIGGYVSSGPIAALVADAPVISEKLLNTIHAVQLSVDGAVQATSKIDQATEALAGSNVQKVVVAQPGILSRAAGNALSIFTTPAITFVLSLFLLTSGTMFYEKIVQNLPKLSDKKRALRIVYNIEQEISRDLFTITAINLGLGLAVASGLWLLGIPFAFVWGMVAAVLNFLPYIGAFITVSLVAILSLATFDSIAFGLVASAFVLTCNIIEGQFVTPMLLGRRLELNTVAVFISISFWTWIWGLIGALLAVPILVAIKVTCDHFDSLNPFPTFYRHNRKLNLRRIEI